MTLKCTRCQADVSFSFIADNGRGMYSGADGYLVCTDFTFTDENGEYRPEHTPLDVPLLRKQRDFLLNLWWGKEFPEEIDGVVNLLDHLLDQEEGFL